MEQMMEFMKGLDWSPLLISLKTGVVATILSFFGGIYAARQVVKAGPKTKAVMDGKMCIRDRCRTCHSCADSRKNEKQK